MGLTDKAISLVSGANGMLCVGSWSNKSVEYSQVDVKEGKGVGMQEGDNWLQPGCYTKPQRSKSTKKSEKLKTELIRMYLEGENDGKGFMGGKNKYTAQRAHS